MRVSFYAGVKYGKIIYFSGYGWLNGLFSLNMETGEVKFLKLFERETLAYRLHRVAFIYKKEAWFIPEMADYIACLNMETMEINYYEVPFYKRNAIENYEDYCVYVKGDILKDKYLCLTPREIDAVLIIDMEHHELYPYYNAIKPEENRIIDSLVIGEILYLLPENGKDYIKINLYTGERDVISCPDGEIAIGSLYNTHDKVWFAGYGGGNIAYMDLVSGAKVQLKTPKPENIYYGMIHQGSKILFLPLRANEFLIVDMGSLTMSFIRPEGKNEIFSKDICRNSIIGSVDDILIAVGATGNIIILDEDFSTFKVTTVDISTADFCHQVVRYVEECGCLKNRILQSVTAMLKQMVEWDRPVIFENERISALVRLMGISGVLDELKVYNKNLVQDDVKIIGRQIWEEVNWLK